MRSELSKRKKQSHAPIPALHEEQQRYRQQMLSGTGRGAVPSADPIYRLSTELVREFDAVGARRNAERHGADTVSEQAEAERGGETANDTERVGEAESRESLTAEQLRRRHDSPVFRHSTEQLLRGDFVDRFSSHAFRGGALAASVMAGRGKEMFTTCIRRASMTPGPKAEEERRLVAPRMIEADVPGQPARLQFGDETHAVVGITVDCIRSVMRKLEIFKQLANDSAGHSQNRLQQHGVMTLREQYPFLQTEHDELRIAQYRAQLKSLEGDDSPQARVRRQALDAALTKATAVRARKAAQERRFLTVLAHIDANVREAERIFSAPDIAEQILTDAAREPDIPPDDGNGRRRTLEGSLLGEILDEWFGKETEAADGEAAGTEDADGRPSADTPTRTE